MKSKSLQYILVNFFISIVYFIIISISIARVEIFGYNFTRKINIFILKYFNTIGALFSSIIQFFIIFTLFTILILGINKLFAKRDLKKIKVSISNIIAKIIYITSLVYLVIYVTYLFFQYDFNTKIPQDKDIYSLMSYDDIINYRIEKKGFQQSVFQLLYKKYLSVLEKFNSQSSYVIKSKLLNNSSSNNNYLAEYEHLYEDNKYISYIYTLLKLLLYVISKNIFYDLTYNNTIPFLLFILFFSIAINLGIKNAKSNSESAKYTNNIIEIYISRLYKTFIYIYNFIFRYAFFWGIPVIVYYLSFYKVNYENNNIIVLLNSNFLIYYIIILLIGSFTVFLICFYYLNNKFSLLRFFIEGFFISFLPGSNYIIIPQIMNTMHITKFKHSANIFLWNIIFSIILNIGNVILFIVITLYVCNILDYSITFYNLCYIILSSTCVIISPLSANIVSITYFICKTLLFLNIDSSLVLYDFIILLTFILYPLSQFFNINLILLYNIIVYKQYDNIKQIKILVFYNSLYQIYESFFKKIVNKFRISFKYTDFKIKIKSNNIILYIIMILFVYSYIVYSVVYSIYSKKVDFILSKDQVDYNYTTHHSSNLLNYNIFKFYQKVSNSIRLFKYQFESNTLYDNNLINILKLNQIYSKISYLDNKQNLSILKYSKNNFNKLLDTKSYNMISNINNTYIKTLDAKLNIKNHICYKHYKNYIKSNITNNITYMYINKDKDLDYLYYNICLPRYINLDGRLILNNILVLKVDYRQVKKIFLNSIQTNLDFIAYNSSLRIIFSSFGKPIIYSKDLTHNLESYKIAKSSILNSFYKYKNKILNDYISYDHSIFYTIDLSDFFDSSNIKFITSDSGRIDNSKIYLTSIYNKKHYLDNQKGKDNFQYNNLTAEVLVILFIIISFIYLIYLFYNKVINNFKDYHTLLSNLELNKFVPINYNSIYDFNLSYSVNKMLNKLGYQYNYLSKYVSNNLIKKMNTSSDSILIGGHKQDLVILFCDIKGFTSISEKLDTKELFKKLSIYFTISHNIIKKYEGTIDKYTGDGIMCFWGAPLEVESKEDKACRAAIQLIIKNTDSFMANIHPFKSNIGIHLGEVIVGNIGSLSQINYTTIGSHVNLASRIESLTRQYNTNILVSENIINNITAKFIYRLIDKVTVKGSYQGIKIYELLGEGEATLLQNPTNISNDEYLEKYNTAVDLFFKQEFESSSIIFKGLHDINPGDIPVKLLLERSNNYIINPPGKDWDGITKMTTK